MRFDTSIVGFILPLLGLLQGCQTEQPPAGAPIERAWEAPSPVDRATPGTPQPDSPRAVAAGGDATAAASQPGAESSGPASPPVAFVNGEPISYSQLTDMLIESHGPGVLEQLVLLTAIKQRAASMSIVVSPADMTAAEDEALRRIAAPVGDPDSAPLDRPAAQRLLADFLRMKGLSQAEWKCRMQQKALLKKIARAEVDKTEITDEMLKQEYGLAYGERVRIRHIQASTPQAIEKAAEQLRSGKRFEEVARELSENVLTSRQGGLMPPFTRHDGSVPPLIREKAFAMKPGETSEPLREGNWYHIIQLEKRFPASGVGFENVDREGLRKQLIERLTRQRSDALESELFQKAKIDIRDDKLDREFRKLHKQGG